MSENETTESASATPPRSLRLAGLRPESRYDEDFAGAHVSPNGELSTTATGDYAQSLWDKITSVNPKMGHQVVEDVVRTLADMRQVEQVRDEIGFDQVERMRILADNEAWTLAGYKNFREFVTSPDRPCSKSAGYRYKAVVEFTETFPVGDKEYDTGLYERFNIPLLTEPGSYDTVDEANRFVARGRFSQVARVATLFNKGTLDHAHAEELLAKSLVLDEDAFDDEIKALTNSDKESVADQLRQQGIFGMCLIVPINEREKGAASLRELADRLENGEDMTGPVVSQEAHEIGKKSIAFHLIPGEDATVVGVI